MVFRIIHAARDLDSSSSPQLTRRTRFYHIKSTHSIERWESEKETNMRDNFD